MFVASESDSDSQVSVYYVSVSPGCLTWRVLVPRPARGVSPPGNAGQLRISVAPRRDPWVDGKTADSLEEAFIQEHMLVRALASLGVRGVVLRKQFGAPGAAIRVNIISLARTCT